MSVSKLRLTLESTFDYGLYVCLGIGKIGTYPPYIIICSWWGDIVCFMGLKWFARIYGEIDKARF